jgi:hypothetical protein
MKKLLIAFSAAAFVLTACQKEPSFEDPNGNPGGGGGSTSGKLVRLGTRMGADSTTTDFTYAGDLLSGLNQSGSANGQSAEAQVSVRRNSANVITRMVTKSDLFSQIGLDDSLVMNFNVNSANSRYVYGVSKFNFMGQPFADSTVYTYDGTGKLVSAVSYFDDGTGYVTDRKEEYTYSGSNLASTKSYIDEGNGLTLVETTTYEYDNKTNPLHFPADAPVLGMSDFYPANNVTKRTVVSADPQDSGTTTATYTYNSDNRPAKSVNTDGSSSSTISYYYQ